MDGFNKYSNNNIFLNTLNDITRDAYSNKFRDIEDHSEDKVKKPVHQFDTSVFMNRETFDNSNNRINSLNEEILSLKKKLTIIIEKDKEIYELKCENEKLNNQISVNGSIVSEIEKLKSENNVLRVNNDKLQIENMENTKTKQENELLKKKINELNSELEKLSIKENYDNPDIQDIMTEDYEKNTSIENENKIDLNIDKLKDVLSSRLKSYHDKHINELINSYNLKPNQKIDKELIEKLLVEAIHI